ADSFDKDHTMLGFLMEKEVKAVDAVLGNIKRPFTAIMGGSKVSTKIGIIENLLTTVDNLILCGGMTYTFSKALGGKIGMSICEDDKLDV
ncbi:phosphoglycerate kinase, partial [Pseudomonas donghuensis]|nr:phosphoglycerate kinase [Pseudomonas donghuensis]